MEELRAELGLDRPLYEQFASFLSDLLHLDLGYSYHLHAPVAEILLDRLGWTYCLWEYQFLSEPSWEACLGPLQGGDLKRE